MATANKSEERAFIRDLLRMYQNLPALWNTSSKEYGDRLKKSQSYSILLDKYNQRYPSATKEDVKKKLNALRTNYRKVKREETDLETKASKCWYWDDIIFLEDKDSPQAQTTSIISLDDVKYATTTQEQQLATDRGKKDLATRNCSREASGTITNDDLNDSEYMRIAWVWANELSKASTEQQMYAKKAINDILFEAQMGTLDRNSVSINDSPQIMHYYTQKGQE